jgi:hypothetical protein
MPSDTKPKRRGPQPPPPLSTNIDPLSGPLKLGEAGGVMRKAAQTVRKLADAGELECVANCIWGPSIKTYWDRNRVKGKRPSAQPTEGRRGRGRPRGSTKKVASQNEGEAA